MALVHTSTLLAVLLCSTPAFAEIYKWVDDSGRVHYGDRSQPRGTEVLQVPAAAPTDPHLAARRRKQQRLLEAIEQEREQEHEAQARAEQQRVRRRHSCARAMDQLRMVERPGRVYDLDDTGERRYWDAQTREHHRARITRYLDENCN